jgi:hypothetical protein
MSAFLVRYYNSGTSAYVVAKITPGPSSVEYPEAGEYDLQRPRDGGAVVQRPQKDGRLRKWFWAGYRDHVPGYPALWTLLKLLKYSTRHAAGYSDPRVQIWDGVTGTGGFGLTTNGADPDLVTYTNIKWTWVKVLRVDRKVRDGSGHPTWESTYIEFVPDDDNYIDAEA